MFTKAPLRFPSDYSYQGKVPNSYMFCRVYERVEMEFLV